MQSRACVVTDGNCISVSLVLALLCAAADEVREHASRLESLA